jgi:glutamate racemase
MSDPSAASIGIFDSGFGGLSVMRAIRTVLPHENIIYFGDTARLPYGSKSRETILRYSIENSSFLIAQGIKVLVIACNTVCSAAFDELQRMFSIPLIGIIGSGVEETIRLTRGGQIAILGTRQTISSGVYQQQIGNILPHAQISAISCPLFVPLVEEGYIEHPLAEMVIQEYLRPLKRKEIDTVLLGCTHYSILQTHIQKALGDQVLLVDPAMNCAEKLGTLLKESGLENLNRDLPHYQFFVSDDPEKFRLLGKAFLNYPIEHVLPKTS